MVGRQAGGRQVGRRMHAQIILGIPAFCMWPKVGRPTCSQMLPDFLELGEHDPENSLLLVLILAVQFFFLFFAWCVSVLDLRDWVNPSHRPVRPQISGPLLPVVSQSQKQGPGSNHLANGILSPVQVLRVRRAGGRIDGGTRWTSRKGLQGLMAD